MNGTELNNATAPRSLDQQQACSPWNFWRLCKSLWDWRAWQRTGSFDEVSGYGGRFFLAEGCIVLRDANGSTELYSPPGVLWLVTSLLAARMARKMKANADISDGAKNPTP